MEQHLAPEGECGVHAGKDEENMGLVQTLGFPVKKKNIAIILMSPCKEMQTPGLTYESESSAQETVRWLRETSSCSPR